MFGLLSGVYPGLALGDGSLNVRPKSLPVVPPVAPPGEKVPQANPQTAPSAQDTLHLAGNQASPAPEELQGDWIVRLKKRAIGTVVKVLGGSQETADDLAKLNPYDLIVKAGVALGLSPQRARRVATTATNPPTLRWEAALGSKAFQILPQQVVNRTMAGTIQKEVARVLPTAGKMVSLENGAGKRTYRVIQQGFNSGRASAERLLAEQGRLNRAIPTGKAASEGVIKVVRREGLWKGPLKLVQSKVLSAQEAIGTLRSQGARTLAGKPVLEAIKAEGNVIQGLKRVARDNYAHQVEKSLQQGIEKGSEKALERTVAEGVVKTRTKAEAQALEKAVAKATESGVTKAAEKGAVRVGARLAGLVPVIGAVAEGAITAYDTKIAYDIHQDPNASKTSAVLADVTVALDGVSTGTVATGWLAPVGWIASGLSIVTGIVRDVTR